MKDIVILIPSLEPKEEFIDFIKKLSKEFSKIVVVNDGSSKKYNCIFESIEKYAVVLKHNKNKGKGTALKTGFSYIKDAYHDVIGVVTADSDGQHAILDIKNVANKLKKHKNKLVLGTRNFSLPNIPLRNKFGNKLTRYLLYNYYNLKIGDTQTGLRGYSFKMLDQYLNIPGDRFEYEMNTLTLANKLNIAITEVRIDTIYSKIDYSSHFNPVKDSIKVYKSFTRYIISSFGCFLLELGLFFIFYKMLPSYSLLFITYITVLSKVLSHIIRYLINRKVYVDNFKKLINFSKYFNWLFLNIIISSLVVYLVLPFKLVVLFKIAIEIILFGLITYFKNLIEFKNR